MSTIGIDSNGISKSFGCIGHGYGSNLQKGRLIVNNCESAYFESYSIGVGLGHGKCFYNKHVAFDGDSENDYSDSEDSINDQKNLVNCQNVKELWT